MGNGPARASQSDVPRRGADRKWDDGAGIKQALGQAGRGLRRIGARRGEWAKLHQGRAKMIRERPETLVDAGISSGDRGQGGAPRCWGGKTTEEGLKAQKRDGERSKYRV